MTAEQPDPIKQLSGAMKAQGLMLATLVGLLENNGQLPIGQMQQELAHLIKSRENPPNQMARLELETLKAFADSLRQYPRG